MDNLKLKCDVIPPTVEVDTKLAKEYKDKNQIKDIAPGRVPEIPIIILYRKLAKKIVENTELFCQLEYLANGTPADDVKVSLKLMEQHFLFRHVSLPKYKGWDNYSDFFIANDYPLAVLGLLPQFMWCGAKSMNIRVVEKREAVCDLFVRLCHEVGLTNVGRCNSYCSDETTYNRLGRIKVGSIGVVTERSDLDSAVDAFLSSSSTGFWRLRHILVQESVYEPFKKALEWKCTVKGGGVGAAQGRVFAYGDKRVLVDACGDGGETGEAGQHEIFAEAYRSSDELPALLRARGGACLSLWASDAAEATEAALAAPTPLVWINDIERFDGPPASCQWFYSHVIFPEPFSYITVPNSDTEERSLEQWRKYDGRTRLNVIYEALETQGDVHLAEFSGILEKILQLNSNEMVEVTKNRICITLDLPVGLLHLRCTSIEQFIFLVKMLVIGNGVIAAVFMELEFKEMLLALSRAGVPVSISDEYVIRIDSPVSDILLSRTKVILSNYGTVFTK